MKLIYFWKDGCPHCTKMDNENKTNESFYEHIIQVEQKNISDDQKKKFGIKMYPTLVFLTDSNRMIGKLEGYHSAYDILEKYKGCNRLDTLFKRTGKLH